MRSEPLFLEAVALFLSLFQVKTMVTGLVVNAIACNEATVRAWADMIGVAVELLPPCDGNMKEVADQKWEHHDVKI